MEEEIFGAPMTDEEIASDEEMDQYFDDLAQNQEERQALESLCALGWE